MAGAFRLKKANKILIAYFAVDTFWHAEACVYTEHWNYTNSWPNFKIMKFMLL